MKRRTLLKRSLAASLTSLAGAGAASGAAWRVAVFEADVTPPLGHACMGGGITAVKSVTDPLHARGCVLLGEGPPIVIVSIEWCEIRNRSYDAWRGALAQAAGTVPARVLVSSTHVHNAPVMDEEAEALLKASGSTGSVGDPAFNAEAISRTVKALSVAMQQPIAVSHYGIGQAKVEGVASNRRVVLPDGRVAYNRMSRCTDPVLRDAAEGDIDPWMKTLSFWAEDR
ncbi:MAG TPA: hypothetical protein VD994_07155, partial [Prosthecobacter sp.]|nr:hypothetical protein [Prosthecobacter sp.]